MKTVFCFPSHARIAVLALLAAWFAGPGEGHAQSPGAQLPAGLTCQKPLPAEGHVTSNPIACTVSCAQGGKVASALALAPRTTAGLTVTIRGTCIEAVDQVPGNVTLPGASSGDGLQAPAASSNPVLGISGEGVTLDDLTISGGVVGLQVRSGAAAVGNNLEIEGASSQNVLTQGLLTLNSSTIENSKGHGIDVLHLGGRMLLNGGTVRNNFRGITVGLPAFLAADGGVVISGNTGGNGVYADGKLVLFNATVEGNSPDGVFLFGEADAIISSPSVVRLNARDGVEVQGGSVEVQGVISNNARHGISVFNGGTASVFNGAVVTANAMDGVFVEDGFANIGGGAGTIQSNGANGIYLKTNSVGYFNNPANKIIGNTGWGILCDGTPANPLITGTIGTVSGNGAGQISCNTAP
jgi:hypothetical protein